MNHSADKLPTDRTEPNVPASPTLPADDANGQVCNSAGRPLVGRLPRAGSKTHELKTWPEPFAAVMADTKTHEIRVADRPFAVGDVLYLREWEHPFHPLNGDGHYTGREACVEVTYLSTGGTWGLPSNLCVMSIRRLP